MIDEPIENQDDAFLETEDETKMSEAILAMEEAGLSGYEDEESFEYSMGDDGEAVLIEDNPSSHPLLNVNENVPFEVNLADMMPDDDLSKVSSDIISWFDADKNSRKEWEETYKNGLSLLGLKVEERTTPWDGACGITHPLLGEAAVRFQSQTVAELIPAGGPVRTKIVGKSTEERIKQGVRIRDHMNYVITEEMVEYEDETDKMLWSLPLVGSAFKKVYKDTTLNRPMAVFVPAEDIVVSYGSASIETTPRLSQILKIPKNEFRKMQVSGFYRDCDLSEPVEISDSINEKLDRINGTESASSTDDRYHLIEMHVDYDLPGFEDILDGKPSGVALPYIITVEKSSGKVLSIYRNWIPDDNKSSRRQYFIHYTYIPGFGFYGLGLIHLVGGIAQGATSILRQLVDAGTLANIPGGFKSRGLKIAGGQDPIRPGEFRDVDIAGGKLSENIMPLPFKEPSPVLLQLLQEIVEEGRRFASLTDVKISSMNQEAPVGTALALLERNLKVMTAIQKRAHRSMRKELKLIAEIIPECYDSYPEGYDPEGDFDLISDYDDRIDVIPVSDPNSSTMAQRIMQYQSALQLSQQNPQIYEHAILHRQMLHELGIPNVEEIIPTDDDIKPIDPVSENMKILNLDPVKAFLHQDHQAHIQAHMLGMQDPKVQEILANSPTAQASVAAAMSHITEHVAYAYRSQIEQSLGVKLPPPGEPLPVDIEVELSKLVAQAASDLFQKNSQEKQQAEAEQQAQDPVFQQRERELALKERQAADNSERAAEKMQIEMEKLRHRMELDQVKLSQEREIEFEKLKTSIVEAIIQAASNSENNSLKRDIKNVDTIMDIVHQQDNREIVSANLKRDRERTEADFIKSVLGESQKANKPPGFDK